MIWAPADSTGVHGQREKCGKKLLVVFRKISGVCKVILPASRQTFFLFFIVTASCISSIGFPDTSVFREIEGWSAAYFAKQHDNRRKRGYNEKKAKRPLPR